MKKRDFWPLLSFFISWRILLFVFLALAPLYIALEKSFLGGGIANYLQNPGLWSWLNFDGVHYLSIAYLGYEPLTYFYFPLYPLLVRLLSFLTGQTFFSQAVWGLILSNAIFLAALAGLWKLIRLDFGKKVPLFVIFVLLLFPTSFFFGAFYTESLFLALAVWSFYFARRGNWFFAGILGGLSSATRILGLAIFPALLIEYLIVRRGVKITRLKVFRDLVCLALIPLGLGLYMFYLEKVTGDPLNFFHAVGIFGEQRSADLVLLPQVFYRHFIKVLPAIDYSYFPVVFSAFLEIGTAILFLGLSIFSFFRLRLSYSVYLVLGYLIPTLSGSFSSLPRYALVLFPAFILIGEWLSTKTKPLILLFFILCLILLGLATALFTRGYWIA